MLGVEFCIFVFKSFLTGGWIAPKFYQNSKKKLFAGCACCWQSAVDSLLTILIITTIKQKYQGKLELLSPFPCMIIVTSALILLNRNIPKLNSSFFSEVFGALTLVKFNSSMKFIAAELNNSEIKLNSASRSFQALKLE